MHGVTYSTKIIVLSSLYFIPPPPTDVLSTSQHNLLLSMQDASEADVNVDQVRATIAGKQERDDLELIDIVRRFLLLPSLPNQIFSFSDN